MKFAFNRGNWEDTNPLPDCQDNEELDDYLERVGFSIAASFFGHRDGGQIEIYESATRNGHFYASVCPSGGTVYEVFLPDFPSMMIFIRDYATAFSAESANCSQKEILSILEKQFQVQHRHSNSTRFQQILSLTQLNEHFVDCNFPLWQFLKPITAHHFMLKRFPVM